MYHTFKKKKKKKKKKKIKLKTKETKVKNFIAIQTKRPNICAKRLDQVVAAYRRLN